MDPMTAMAVAKGAGSVFGAIQGAIGKKKMNEADKMGPETSDPVRLSALEDAKRKTKQMESGTDTTTQEAVKSANQSTAATQKQLSTVTGGAVGGTVSAMLQAMKMGGNIKNQAFAKSGERGIQMGAVSNQIGKEISQRKLDIEQFRSVQRRAEGADALKTGMANAQAGLFGSLPTSKDGTTTAGSEGLFAALQERMNPSAATTPSLATPPIVASSLAPSAVKVSATTPTVAPTTTATPASPISKAITTANQGGQGTAKPPKGVASWIDLVMNAGMSMEDLKNHPDFGNAPQEVLDFMGGSASGVGLDKFEQLFNATPNKYAKKQAQ